MHGSPDVYLQDCLVEALAVIDEKPNHYKLIYPHVSYHSYIQIEFLDKEFLDKIEALAWGDLAQNKLSPFFVNCSRRPMVISESKSKEKDTIEA